MYASIAHAVTVAQYCGFPLEFAFHGFLVFAATSDPSRQIVLDATRRRVSIDELVQALRQQGGLSINAIHEGLRFAGLDLE